MIDLSMRHIMAIVNVTPDSFFEGSRTLERDSITRRVHQVVEEGATIVDIGGYSSRPGAEDISLEEEWRRVDLGVGVVRELYPEIAISVDTFRAEIVERVAQRYGQFIVNDIMGGEGDPAIFAVAAQYSLPYVAMHMRGTPQDMQSQTQYSDVVEEVKESLRRRIELMREAGVEEIVLDPGFGFAKSLEQNYELLSGIPRLRELGYPILVGISRKSMIYKVLDTTPAESLTGTIALNWEALRGGAQILRVHDVREGVEILKLYEKYVSKLTFANKKENNI